MKFQIEKFFFSVPIYSLFFIYYLNTYKYNKNGNRDEKFFILKFHIFLQENLIFNVEGGLHYNRILRRDLTDLKFMCIT